MKIVLTFSLLILLSGSALAQTDDADLVRRAALNYIEGFYEGDTWMIGQVIWEGPLEK